MTTITINRAVAEQALEALTVLLDHLDGVPADKVALADWIQAEADLCSALAQQAKPKPMSPEQRQRWEELAAMPQQAEPVEPVAKVIATAPKRIWLDLGFDPADEDITFDQLFEATWSQDNATGWGIEYVRADLVAPPQRKPLTDEEIDAMWRDAASEEGFTTAQFVRNFARAVERAHGIGDNT